MSYAISGGNVVRSLSTGLLVLLASAGPALAATTAESTKAKAAAGNGGVGIGAPSSLTTTKAKATGGGTIPGTTPASPGVIHLGDRTLKQGMKGHDVRVLQDYLSRVGYRTAVDGDFGPGTAKNVKVFQRVQGMKANGVVTLAVSNALRAAVAKAKKATSAPVGNGRLNADGTATPPANAPTTIKKLFAAANKIATKPYIYGGGHASFSDSGYDCSGSLSYALHGAGLLSSPLDSTELESYGSSGAGHWISIWSNSGHTYMYVAGLRYDTSAQSSTGGSRWTDQSRSNRGFVESHPTGW